MFVQSVQDETTKQIEDTLGPKYTELHETIGAKMVDLDLDKEKLDLLVTSFEKYAKEWYNNKEKMIEIYELITKK